MISKFALDFAHITEQAAVAAYKWMGKGDEKSADRAAVDAMRMALNKLDIEGTVVIGEGERDEAPMLYIGEQVGTSLGPKCDIAVDPLEGTTILSTGADNALAVLAVTESGGFLHAPDVYMEKIAIGFNYIEQIIDLDNTTKVNLLNVAKAKKCDISEITVMVLDRSRHEELIAQIHEVGARIKLIKDGDIAGIIGTTTSEVDIYMGIGGAPEGVLAAAALCATGGQMCGRLLFRDNNEKERAAKAGITNLSKQYYLNDLASGDIVFAATGVTDGSLVQGVQITDKEITTETILLFGRSKQIKTIYSTKLL